MQGLIGGIDLWALFFSLTLNLSNPRHVKWGQPPPSKRKQSAYERGHTQTHSSFLPAPARPAPLPLTLLYLNCQHLAGARTRLNLWTLIWPRKANSSRLGQAELLVRHVPYLSKDGGGWVEGSGRKNAGGHTWREIKGGGKRKKKHKQTRVRVREGGRTGRQTRDGGLLQMQKQR